MYGGRGHSDLRDWGLPERHLCVENGERDGGLEYI